MISCVDNTTYKVTHPSPKLLVPASRSHDQLEVELEVLKHQSLHPFHSSRGYHSLRYTA
jgi:hypothetical protein